MSSVGLGERGCVRLDCMGGGYGGLAEGLTDGESRIMRAD
jgi:hypothetical protein